MRYFKTITVAVLAMALTIGTISAVAAQDEITYEVTENGLYEYTLPDGTVIVGDTLWSIATMTGEVNEQDMDTESVTNLDPSAIDTATVTNGGIFSTSKTGWNIWYTHDEIDPNIKAFLNDLPVPDPANWGSFPNVDNPSVGFKAKHGLEYANESSPFCEHDLCDLPVPAQSYTFVSGDYIIGDEFGTTLTCADNGSKTGCALTLVNVSDRATRLDDIHVDAGFKIMGRYWWGEHLPKALHGIVSHSANNMMNLESDLNDPEGANAGSNCFTADGCNGVLERVGFVHHNGEIVAYGEYVVPRPVDNK